MPSKLSYRAIRIGIQVYLYEREKNAKEEDTKKPLKH